MSPYDSMYDSCPSCGRRKRSKATTCRECWQASRFAAQEARFWSLVDKTETCWIWRGWVATNGYGRFHWQGGTEQAHRLAWRLGHGRPVPDGLVLDHLCRQPLCVRPSHLDPVTQRENVLRGLGPASRATCPNGHEFDGMKRDGDRVYRFCRTCVNARRALTRPSRAKLTAALDGAAALAATEEER